MESLKSKKFDKLEEQKLNDLVNVTGGYGGEDTVEFKMSGSGSLQVQDTHLDRTHVGKGPALPAGL